MKSTKFLALVLALFLLTAVFVACSEDSVDTDFNEKQTIIDNEQTDVEQEQIDVIEKNTDANETQTNEMQTNEMQTNESENSEAKYKIFTIGDFHDGLALIEANTGYGYINTKGKIVIEPYFDEASEEFNILAVVTEGNTKKFINKKAETVYLFNGTETGFGSYSNGFFWIETMEETVSGNIYTMTYYNQYGEKQMSIANAEEATDQIPNHNLNAWSKVNLSLSSFNKWGYAIVKIDGKNKFVNTHGDVMLFDGLEDSYNVRRYQDNYVLIDSSLYYIDYENKTASLLPGNYWAHAYEVNVQPLGNEYYGNYNRYTYYKEYTKISKNNTEILFSSIPQLGSAVVKGLSSFVYNGETYFVLYLVNSSNVFWSTVIDSNGNVMFSPTNRLHLGYNSYYVGNGGSFAYCDYSCYSFSSGLCKALNSETKMYGYIDINGNWVIEPNFSNASDFYGEGNDAVAVINENTIIDRNGNVVFSIVSNNK